MCCMFSVCVARYGQLSPHNLNEQSSTIWFQMWSKRSQTWTLAVRTWHTGLGRCILLFQPGANDFKAESVWTWQYVKKDRFSVEGDLSIPDNSLMSVKKVQRLTGFCGFLAAFLIGQTCSSCCWTERHYWFSTQRTRRLHRCPMTWLTGYLSPGDLCLSAEEKSRTIQHYFKKRVSGPWLAVRHRAYHWECTLFLKRLLQLW